jgi:hypothetical protein
VTKKAATAAAAAAAKDSGDDSDAAVDVDSDNEQEDTTASTAATATDDDNTSAAAAAAAAATDDTAETSEKAPTATVTTKLDVPMYKEARRLFLQPDVNPPESYDLKWTDPDEAGLTAFLVEKMQFNAVCITSNFTVYIYSWYVIAMLCLWSS